MLPALLDRVSSQQRVENRVDGLLEILYEDSVSGHHCLLYHIHIAETTDHNEKGSYCYTALYRNMKMHVLYVNTLTLSAPDSQP